MCRFATRSWGCARKACRCIRCTAASPTSKRPTDIKFAAVKALVENQTHYAPSSGLLPLRKALVEKLAAKNHIHVTTDEVIATVGGSQGLYAAFQSVLDPGDDALVFSPYWTPIGDLVTGAQARPLLVPTITARRNGIRKTLEQFSTPKTRAIYYNTPQNPSGLVFTRAEAEEVAAFAIERDLVVIADEAYEDLVYDGEHVSIASLPGMARADDHLLHFFEDLCHDRLARRICGGPRTLHDCAAQNCSLLHQRRDDTRAVRNDPRAQNAGDRDRRATAKSIASAAICWLSALNRSGPGMRAARGRVLCLSQRRED